MPTPLAVALSDFCRRAQSPASAAEVREALALLSPEDEFRVRELTDREPPASPLGPFAVVDVLSGTPPHLAAQRQAVGYYEVARTLAAERTSPPPRAPEAPVAPPPTPELEAAAKLRELLAPAEAKRRQRKDEKPTVAERIAPKRRAAQAPQPQEPEAPAEPESAGQLESPHPERPAPRGRFTRIAPPKQPSSALLAPEAKDALAAFAQQHPNRFALHRALSTQYGGRRGALALEDVLAALERHGLLDALARKEREAVLAAFAEHRGAAGKAAWSLGVAPPELRSLIKALGLEEQVESLRDGFRREALAPKNLAQRLDLAARGKYLDDLGFRRQFSEHLARDLRALFRSSSARGENAVEEVARREGLDPTQLGRALDRLGLSQELEHGDRGRAAHPTS